MAEVCIDVTRLVGRFFKGRLPTGVDRVMLAYISQYQHQGYACTRFGGRIWFASKPLSALLFEMLLLRPSLWFRWRCCLLLVRAWLSHWQTSAPDGCLMFNVGHSGLEQTGYARQLAKLGSRPVFMVHDLIPISHPEYCRPGEKSKHELRMRTVLKLASGVICNSQSTLNSLSRYAHENGLPMPAAIAAPLAPAPLPAPESSRPLPQPYFVVIGTIEPRKNHTLLFVLWRTLIARYGAFAPKLVVIGQRGWECENALDLLERCESLRGHVLEFGSCSDSELATWLHHAQALLFPSFAEGYGMPLVEALSLGVPVIASDLPAFREIADDIPDYLDPVDGLGWMASIEAYMEPSSPRRLAQLQRLSTFKTPSWGEHFAQVDTWLASWL